MQQPGTSKSLPSLLHCVVSEKPMDPASLLPHCSVTSGRHERVEDGESMEERSAHVTSTLYPREVAAAEHRLYFQRLRRFFDHHDPTWSDEEISSVVADALQQPHGMRHLWYHLIVRYGPDPVSREMQGTMRELLLLSPPSSSSPPRVLTARSNVAVAQHHPGMNMNAPKAQHDSFRALLGMSNTSTGGNMQTDAPLVVAIQITGMNESLYGAARPSCRRAFRHALGAQMSFWVNCSPSRFRVTFHTGCTAVVYVGSSDEVDEFSDTVDVIAAIERAVRGGGASMRLIRHSYRRDLKGGSVIMALTMTQMPIPDPTKAMSSVDGTGGITLDDNDEDGDKSSDEDDVHWDHHALLQKISPSSCSPPPPSFFYRGRTLLTEKNSGEWNGIAEQLSSASTKPVGKWHNNDFLQSEHRALSVISIMENVCSPQETSRSRCLSPSFGVHCSLLTHLNCARQQLQPPTEPLTRSDLEEGVCCNVSFGGHVNTVPAHHPSMAM